MEKSILRNEAFYSQHKEGSFLVWNDNQTHMRL